MFILTTLILSFSSKVTAIDVIPRPSYFLEKEGTYITNVDVSIFAGSNVRKEAAFLARILKTDFAFDKVKTTLSRSADIRLLINKVLERELGKEGYRLQVDQTGVLIEAPTATGIFYGIQTLRQLLQKESNVVKLGFVTIIDQPRFSWRSYMLDDGRAFKGKEVVKKMLDEMALLKMNIFHWHLTEDQGWRLAIEKYPNLTRIGGRRDSTQLNGWNSTQYDGKPLEGYYTKADVREIVAYAAERHIKVIPEIEMPGHASAAIASYPWLGVSKQPIRVPTNFGVKYDIFDVTEPAVIEFIHNVLNEVIAMFPSDVIHIGGDEVKYDQWIRSSSVQAYMKKHALSSPADLQIFFTNGISNFLEKKKKRMMGWNDIMGAKLHDYNQDSAPVTGTLAQSTIVHFWKGDLDMVKDAVSKGYDVVNSFHIFTYLDYDYNTIPVEKAYSFDPIPQGLDERYHNKILGLGCQMWGEWIPTVTEMYQKTFPRIAAYAEVGWTKKENKDFTRFQQALPYFYNRWKRRNINFHQ
jgi:hexosaminidase